MVANQLKTEQLEKTLGGVSEKNAKMKVLPCMLLKMN